MDIKVKSTQIVTVAHLKSSQDAIRRAPFGSRRRWQVRTYKDGGSISQMCDGDPLEGRIKGEGAWPGAVTAAHGRIVFSLVLAAGMGIFNPAVLAGAVEEGESEFDAKTARTR